jgi:hypothetical protein
MWFDSQLNICIYAIIFVCVYIIGTCLTLLLSVSLVDRYDVVTVGMQECVFSIPKTPGAKAKPLFDEDTDKAAKEVAKVDETQSGGDGGGGGGAASEEEKPISTKSCGGWTAMALDKLHPKCSKYASTLLKTTLGPEYASSRFSTFRVF